jgi:hypothetical protein
MSNKYPGGIITSGANAGYSVFFDGTGDYLTVPNNSAFLFGTGDFTVEFWVNFSSISSTYQCIAAVWQGSTNYAWNISINNANVSFAYGNGGSSGSSVTFACTPTTNTWAHFAVTRASNSVRCFLNGAQIGTTQTISNNLTSGTSLYIGANQDAGPTQYVNGYVSNLRIIKGTALYTAAFTPPTQLFAITNTSLLTCNSPAIVDQSSNNFTITANGNAAVSTFTPFTGTQLVPNPNTLANTQGVWSISDAAYWMSQNKWPMPPNYPLQSLRFNSADTAYLNRTPASAGNRRVWTWSCWFKFSLIASANYRSFIEAFTGSADVYNSIAYENAVIKVNQDNGAGGVMLVSTPAVFRDPGAWYHLVVAVDTTQATGTNRVKLWINGVQQTLTFSVTPAQNLDTWINSANAHRIGARWSGPSSASNYDGYMADVNFIDGQALTPSSFGANDPNTGVWSPVPYSGTYGTNGFRLSFQDNTGTTATTLGKDYSGNGNNWTPNNFSVAAGSGNDSLTDGPTNWGIDYGNGGEVRGNYCTLNSLDNGGNTIANGNLDSTRSGSSWVSTRSTLGMSSGKWYWEITAGAGVSSSNQNVVTVGLMTSAATLTSYPGSDANGWGYNSFDGRKYNNQSGGTGTGTTYGATWTTGDIIGVAFDADAGSLTFYKNGVSQGAAYTSLAAGTYFAAVGSYASSSTLVSLNFGQRPFAYTAPSGFKVLCTTNLPIPTVGATSTTLANKYFDATLYTGTGSALTVTNAGSFQPDLVWYKDRSAASSNALFDAIRGVTAYLSSDSTAAEQTISGVTAFNSNGFSLGTNAGGNTNGRLYVGWQWNAGNSSVSNTSGTITSTVRANQTAGISIVTYTGNGTSGATVGHGLGVAPRMVITKKRETGGTDGWWATYHASLSANTNLMLNSTSAAAGTASWTQGIIGGVSSSTFTLTSGGTGAANVNDNTYDYVAYCFAEVAGFSKFGSYTGNGSSDGPFVYCGFRPRWIMWKKTNSSTNAPWVVVDTSRSPYNLAREYLLPNASDAEASVDLIDVVSNGFKWRGTAPGGNNSGDTYIFAAFAEAPFNYSRAR